MVSAGQEAHPTPRPLPPGDLCLPLALPSSVWSAAPREPRGTHIPLPVGKAFAFHFKNPCKMEKMKLRDKRSETRGLNSGHEGEALGPTSQSAAAPPPSGTEEGRPAASSPFCLGEQEYPYAGPVMSSCPSWPEEWCRGASSPPSQPHLAVPLSGGWGPACVSSLRTVTEMKLKLGAPHPGQVSPTGSAPSGRG